MMNVDVVYHCAATAHEGLSVFSPFEITKNNYLASVSVFTAAISNKVKRIIFCSSMARYGTQKNPFTEDMPTKPQDPYGIAKVAVEQTLQLLCEVHGMDYNIAIPHNIVGPNQKYDDPYRNVMSIFINRNLQMKPSIIYGDGKQIRDWLYVEDHARALVLVATKSQVGKTYNIGGHNEKQTIEVVRVICQLLEELAPEAPHSKASGNTEGYEGLITYVTDRPGHDLRYAIDASKIAEELDWKPVETFESGIRKTVQWYLEHSK